MSSSPTSPARKLPFHTVDVFTRTRFAGNPLAIVHEPAGPHPSLTQDQRQAIAREFNLSETIFVYAPHKTSAGDETPEWDVNIHTIKGELPFAGHPTVGVSCHLLSQVAETTEQGIASNAAIKANLSTGAGRIGVSYNHATGIATLNVPHNYHQHDTQLISGVLQKMQPQLPASDVDSPVSVSIVKGMTFMLVRLDDVETLSHVIHNQAEATLMKPLNAEWDSKLGGVLFYVPLQDSPDGTRNFRVRMIEVDYAGEDAATGSACCCLAAYQTLTHSQDPVTKFSMTQGVEMGRPSNLGITIHATSDPHLQNARRLEQVLLHGTAVPVQEGTLVAPTLTT
jgi:PhzF family phenazine biosynthesis protein